MDFALIGHHPDGLALTEALAATGRFQLTAYAGPADGAAALRAAGLEFRTVPEVEELLALAATELILVADDLAFRPAVLKRAAQSDKHVLCVFPPDLAPDIGYEILMVLQDTRKKALPLLAERLAPGLRRLRDLVGEGALGPLQVVEWERSWRPAPAAASTQPPPDRKGRKALPPTAAWEGHPALLAWDVLRPLGGEVREVSALAAGGAELLGPADALTLTGKFESGALFQLLFTPGDVPTAKLVVRGEKGRAELLQPAGPFGPAELRWTGAGGEQKEAWPAWDPWPALAAAVDEALKPGARSAGAAATWADALRGMEIFEAVRASVRRRRLIALSYETATEEANFKSTMTAAGCLLLLALMVLFFTAPFVPGLKYVFLPLLLLFLGLQLFRWIIPAPPDRARDDKG